MIKNIDRTGFKELEHKGFKLVIHVSIKVSPSGSLTSVEAYSDAYSDACTFATYRLPGVHGVNKTINEVEREFISVVDTYQNNKAEAAKQEEAFKLCGVCFDHNDTIDEVLQRNGLLSKTDEGTD